MKTVYKYPLDGYITEIKLPMGAITLYAAAQGYMPQLWVALNTDVKLMNNRQFVIVGTGHVLPEGELAHINSFLMDQDRLVFHVFEILG